MSLANLDALIQAKSPLLYFKLHDLADYPNIPNHGSGATTASWKGGQPVQLESLSGPVVELNGSRWVELLGGGVLDTSNGFTVEALVYFDEPRNYMRLFELGASNRSAIFATGFIATNNELMTRYYNGSTSSSTAIALSDFFARVHHLVGVIDPVSGTQKLYLNGQLVNEAANTFVLNSINAELGNLFYSLWAQTGSSGDQIAKGGANYLAVYLEPLTAQQVAEHATEINGLGLDIVESIQYNHQPLRSRLTWANQETPGQAAPDLAPVADIGFRTNGPVPNLPITGRLRPGNGNDHFTPGRNIPLGNIDAMVTLQGSPVARPVFVLNQRGVILRQTHSGANGRYVVEGLEQDQRYIVFALDEPDREYNAAISDYVKPE